MKGKRRVTPLTELRVNAGLTRMEAAIIMKIANESLTRYEMGMNDIPFGVGEMMAKVYNVSFEDIRQAVRSTKEMVGAAVEGKRRSSIKKDKTDLLEKIRVKKMKSLSNMDLINSALKEAEKWKGKEAN
ncbi:MAG: helix-turn-helix transcriptional regulator [Synergistaceae bacterium]|nr:helix-turn-helix transcriptional regulator [Synergistaceae bacterium]